MNFFNWMTDYQLYCSQCPKHERLPYEEFLKRRNKQLSEKFVVGNRRLITEVNWVSIGSPYYKIHPKMVTKLCKSDLTKIPSLMLKMPHGLNVVNIRFCQQHPEFTVDEQHNSNAVLPAGSFLRSILMSKHDGLISFIMDFGLFDKMGQSIYSLFGIFPKESFSIQECIDQSVALFDQRIHPYYRMIANIMRLAVTIGFLSDNPTICEADVLNADRAKYADADDERREVIAARARRKGKFGFNIGTDLMFLGERQSSKPKTHTATGRELEYAHIRAGHPHAVRYGENKKLVKIMWYVPVTVREDLPFKTK